MNMFTLVSLDTNNKAVTESVDTDALMRSAQRFAKVSNVNESLAALTNNGYRVIVNDVNAPYLYSSGNGIYEEANPKHKQLRQKFEDKLNNNAEDANSYESIRAAKMQDGTWNGTKPPKQPAQQPTQEQVPQSNKPNTVRDAIPAMVARIENMFKSDPDGFKMLLVQLQNKLK
jgi:hypothetical protein